MSANSTVPAGTVWRMNPRTGATRGLTTEEADAELAALREARGAADQVAGSEESSGEEGQR